MKGYKRKSFYLQAFFVMFLCICVIGNISLSAIAKNTNSKTQESITLKIGNKKVTKKQKVLVVYFSVTGTTKSAAKKIKKATNGILYQIKAKNPYTKEDINYNYEQCRANVEQNNGKVRPEIKGKIKGIRKYDVIFVGYPIWWGKEPMIIRTFLESYNLKGKKIVPFCTSGGSGISGSMEEIKASAKGAKIKKGRDLTDVSQQEVKSWAKKIINK